MRARWRSTRGLCVPPLGVRWVYACSAVVVVVPGCAFHYRVTVTGNAIHNGLEDLRKDNKAIVDATVHNYRRVLVLDKPWRIREPIYLAQQLDDAGTKHLLANLLKNCPDVPPFAEDRASGTGCWLVEYRDK